VHRENLSPLRQSHYRLSRNFIVASTISRSDLERAWRNWREPRGSHDTHINSDTPCCVLQHEEFHFSGDDDCLLSRVGRASHRARENRKRSRRTRRQSTKPRFSASSPARFSANQDHVYGSCTADVCAIHKFSPHKNYRPNGLSC